MCSYVEKASALTEDNKSDTDIHKNRKNFGDRLFSHTEFEINSINDTNRILR